MSADKDKEPGATAASASPNDSPVGDDALLSEDVLGPAEERLKASEAKREETKRKLADGQYSGLDTQARLRARVERVTQDPVARREIENRGDDLVESLGTGGDSALDDELLERIINGENFLGVSFFDLGKRAAHCVGRVEIRTPDGRSGSGTGSMVTSRLFLTNNHVLRELSWARSSRVVFDHEDDADGNPRPTVTFAFDPDAFFLTNKDLDFTLVAVKEEAAQPAGARLSAYGFNPLDASPGKIAVGEVINIIQHPSGMHKQVVLQDNRVLNIPSDTPEWLHYEADTLPGSSGAPLFNNRWEVVGLHHAGWPRRDPLTKKILTKKGDEWTKEMGELAIDWLGNEGARVSHIVKKAGEARPTLTPEAQAFLDELLLPPKQGTVVAAGGGPASPSPPEESAVSIATPTPRPQPAEKPLPQASGLNTPDETTAAPRPADTIAAPLVTSHGGAVTFTIPLQITLSLGVPVAEPRPEAERPATTFRDDLDLDEVVRIDPNYSNRKGYDPDFLGVPVPLPTLTDAQRKSAAMNNLTRPGADPTVLPYNHFSIVMNRKRRMAFYTACNIDGARWVKIVRKEFKGDRDTWHPDPRIPALEQTGDRHYKFQHIDRGHLVRREDPNWGDSPEAAKKANDDTFHFTNCTPQHSDFNRRADHWQGIEKFVLEGTTAARRRATLFTGPVFKQSDPELNGVQVPLAFWKILVFRRKDGSLSASAYLLEQSEMIQDLLEATFDAGEYQVSIKEIIKLTKLDFSHLVAHDALKQQGDGTEEVEGLGPSDGDGDVRVPLASFDDVSI